MKDAKTLVESRNFLYKEINKSIPTILEFIEKNVGQKVWKMDGCITNKFQTEIDNLLPHSGGKIKGGYLTVHSWFQKTGKHLYVKFKICFSGGKHEDRTYFCHYQEQSVLIGTVNGERTIIETVRETPFENFDIIDLKSELKKIEKYKIEKAKLDKLYRDIDYTLRDAYCK